ncbi:S8 family peptidase [Bdellovibrio reynosensis]|uniref:S8 family serine peptidase n=1 Tax=Bdellovibrio reynosensis TaxID=2835041 RepID=A0ABY4C816_9BACT|nr:S8 family peptidase [Bdellovibrio reynosensis]UOF01132.1 S8 family serine peptidase [Bdellovibrio reynosensis]
MNKVMNKMSLFLGMTVISLSFGAQANSKKQDLLIKLAPGVMEFQMQGAKVEKLNDSWVRVQTSSKVSVQSLEKNPAVEYVQPNYKITLIEDYKIQDPLRRAALAKMLSRNPQFVSLARPDNPAIPDAPQSVSGADPLFNKQWGMLDIGVVEAWKVTRGNPEMVVAVIDTGVDYTHEDLLPNMWRNPKEIANNNIDDDNNGYVDDIVGWDFVTNDNKPYDLSFDSINQLFKGGNPGHGTHVAGCVAAAGNNSKGVAGVAPNVKIMALRFIAERGGGTTADAIKSITYAVDNGAKVMNNSWGSEGEEPGAPENKALRDAVQYAQDKGVLFIAAAGNGHKGVGYDNDTDKLPAYPASYDHDIIISVAALDVKDQLGSFSNWGARGVDIGAPGVKVFSTTVGNNYSDTVIDKFGIKATWDGTSMAAPHVAGAAALYWSANPTKSWQDVKAALLGSVKKVNSLANKSVSGGKLDVEALMKY